MILYLRVVSHVLLSREDDVVVASEQEVLQLVDGADLYYVVALLDYFFNRALLQGWFRGLSVITPLFDAILRYFLTNLLFKICKLQFKFNKSCTILDEVNTNHSTRY